MYGGYCGFSGGRSGKAPSQPCLSERVTIRTSVRFVQDDNPGGQ